MRIDIGCGARKHPGFVGIDRLPYPGVDLVCDLNGPLPLPDGSVEFVMASRSLPYVDDLFSLWRELYRVCAPRAVVCVLAPYAHNFLHASNPSLKHRFDEYTPRYLTRRYFQPSSCPPVAWSPEYEDESPLPFDFRLLRMELFYRLPYEEPLYERNELEELRTLQANVVAEIMYHFLAVKEDMKEEDLERFSRHEFPEPCHAAPLRHVFMDSSENLAID